jgi:hypothetical protein
MSGSIQTKESLLGEPEGLVCFLDGFDQEVVKDHILYHGQLIQVFYVLPENPICKEEHRARIE